VVGFRCLFLGRVSLCKQKKRIALHGSIFV
jgi:hypothetical protein